MEIAIKEYNLNKFVTFSNLIRLWFKMCTNDRGINWVDRNRN
jgi:hypothetical protein